MEHLYDEEGRLRDPKRSLYYDAVYNPFGVPPPGMPYRERSESSFHFSARSARTNVKAKKRARMIATTIS